MTTDAKLDDIREAYEKGRRIGFTEDWNEGLAIGRVQGAIGMALVIIALYALSRWLGGSIL